MFASSELYARGGAKHQLADIDAGTARDTLDAPTLMRAFANKKLLDDLWPLCARLKAALFEGQGDEALLAEFDLYREVLFALTRLDHPFIDLWLSCPVGAESERRLAVEEQVRVFCARLAMQSCEMTSFNNYRVFRQLAQGWKLLLKTNFADIKSKRRKSGRYDHGTDRKTWRTTISQRITSIEPVEWANGQNAASRPDIAWRFRMPGYPMALVSTSVLQEGEGSPHVLSQRHTLWHFRKPVRDRAKKRPSGSRGISISALIARDVQKRRRRAACAASEFDFRI